MRCALVEISSNIVQNVIIADPAKDPAPEGTIIVGIPDDSPVSFGWIYDPTTGNFSNPNPVEP